MAATPKRPDVNADQKIKLPWGAGTIFWSEAEQCWMGEVSLGRDPTTGKRRRRKLRGATPEEIDAELTRIKFGKGRGLPVHASRQTVKQYLVWWLEHGLDVRESTWRRYEQFCRLQIVPRIGYIRLDRLTPQHVRMLLADVQDHGRIVRKDRKKPKQPPPPTLSPRSAQQCHAVLRSALNEAVRLEIIARNPAELVKPPRVPKRRVEPFTVVQAKRLLTAIRGDWDEGLIRVALALGLREGEALGLRWSDVDLVAGTLTISKQLQRRERPDSDAAATSKTALQLVDLKSDSSQRTIALPAQIVAALHEHRRRQLTMRLAAGRRWQEHDLVFPSSIGTPREASNMLRRFQQQLADVGLPKKRFHDLRHTAASLLLAQGVPMKLVQALLGHSQIGLTADTYTHLLEEVQRDLAAQMDTLLVALESEQA